MMYAVDKDRDPFIQAVLERVTAPLALAVNYVYAMSAFEHLMVMGGLHSPSKSGDWG